MEDLAFWIRFSVGCGLWVLIGMALIWLWHAMWSGRLATLVLGAVDWLNGEKR